MKASASAPESLFTPHGTRFSVDYRTLVAAGRVDLLTYGEGADVAFPGMHDGSLHRL